MPTPATSAADTLSTGDGVFDSSHAVREAIRKAKAAIRAHKKVQTPKSRSKAIVAANQAAVAYASHTRWLSPENAGGAIRWNIEAAAAWSETARRLLVEGQETSAG